MGTGALGRYLYSLGEEGATDLHLKPGSPPKLRCNGELAPLRSEATLLPAEVQEIVEHVLTDDARRSLAVSGEAWCTHAVSGIGRFRVRAFSQRGSIALVIRRIPDKVASIDELGVPQAVEELTAAPAGLVIVAGPPRSGRRTTLASMLDHLNRTRAVHVVAVERPVELLHRDVMSSVSQLEVGADTPSFAAGIHSAVASDGDVVVVSDIEDAETAEAALSAVEDGLLVLAGMDGASVVDVLGRFLGFFPAGRRDSVRLSLSAALLGTVCQRLAPTIGGAGRAPVVEVVPATTRVRELLLEADSLAAIAGLVSAGGDGMQSFEAAIADLVEQGRIDLRGALAVTEDWDGLRQLLNERGLLAAEPTLDPVAPA